MLQTVTVVAEECLKGAVAVILAVVVFEVVVVVVVVVVAAVVVLVVVLVLEVFDLVVDGENDDESNFLSA